MNYKILKTGSKGNCIIVEDKFMLDCGVPYKLVEPYLKDIKVIFISHCHKDHINMSTIKRILFEYPNIKCICGIGVYPKIDKKEVKLNRFHYLEAGKWYSLGSCQLKLDTLYHDVPNYGLHLKYHNKLLFYATDTNSLKGIKAYGYDNYLIEANYDTKDDLDREILEHKKKNEYTHLERVKYTHLSQLDALNWLDENNINKSKYEFIHTHEGGE